MAWLKGVRTDGFIKINENVNFRGTVLGAGSGIISPYKANHWYVDGTDGLDSYSGKSWEGAKKTIQAAITAQGNDTDSKGDVIWIAPGHYTEVLTGNLTNVMVIGATCGGVPEAVSIRPSTGSAYTGAMTNAGFYGIEFRNSSGTEPSAPAVTLTDMYHSIIDNCVFAGVNTDGGSKGILIGALTEGTWETMLNSKITNCRFSTNVARGNQFITAIKIGNGNTNQDTRQFIQSEISGNTIYANQHGIYIDTGESNNGGSSISNNFISSNENYGRVLNGIEFIQEDQLCMVTNNRIIANESGDAIINCYAGNALHNVVSEEGVIDLIGWFE